MRGCCLPWRLAGIALIDAGDLNRLAGRVLQRRQRGDLVAILLVDSVGSFINRALAPVDVAGAQDSTLEGDAMTIPTTQWRTLINQVCQETPPVDPIVLEAMVLVESNGNPKARSASDARGLCQLIPKWHATGVGKKVAAHLGKPLTDDLWFDPEFSLRAGALHLRWCQSECGSWETGVAKYHSGQCHPPPGFEDGQGTSTVYHLVKFREAMDTVRADRNQTGELIMATHKYILSAGHRNTDRGGAKNEINWTYPATVALKEAIEARGGKAWIVQEHDGDDDPTFSHGRGLQAVARRCLELAEELGPFDAYISMHYNGGPSPGFHAIHAHGAGDTKEMNPLDVKLCEAIVDRVRATNTVDLISWTSHCAGVMSERETGVGGQGFRLGEMVGTLGFRDTTARVIVEAGSIDVPRERAYIDDPQWVRNVYCEAIVDGLEDVFGKFKETKPEPISSQSKPVYVKPSLIPEVAELPGYVKLANGAQLVLADYMVKAIRETPRLRYAALDAEHIGPPIATGVRFAVQYLVINPDGSLFYYTPYGTRVAYEDIKPFFPDVDDAMDAVDDAMDAAMEAVHAD